MHKVITASHQRGPRASRGVTRHRVRVVLASTLSAVALIAVACGGSAGRLVAVTVRDEACEPARIAITPGERVTFQVRNEARTDREFEGIEGTQIAEALVPAGRTRSFDYTVPTGDQSHRVKCYSPGGPTTIIELVPGAAPVTK